MNITLADLLELEPRLTVALAGDSSGGGDSMEEIELSWAVSARGTPPHLPQLRGGELVLVPGRVAAAMGDALPALLREVAVRGACATVLDTDAVAKATPAGASDAPIVLAWDGSIGADAETAINRLLTECRGDLYRIGSDLERSLTDVAVTGSGLGALVSAVAYATGLSLAVRDGSGKTLASAGEAGDGDHDTGAGRTIERRLPSGASLRVGPGAPPLSIAARFFADRIAFAASAAMQRDAAARPRGARRIEAIEKLLLAETASEAERRTLALALGLDPDGLYFVAVSKGASEAAVGRLLGGLGLAMPAGNDLGARTTLVAADRTTGENLTVRSNDVKRRWLSELVDAGQWLALSSPIAGVVNLPTGAAEALFLAAYQRRLRPRARAVSFDSVSDVGSLRLLFPLRESPVLRQFVAEALGPLLVEDGRGVLRETLQAYFDSGGSQVDAAGQLGIHRNTLTYRLRRISTVIGRDVTDPGCWLTLHLALRAADVLDICSELRTSSLNGGRG
jgi:purine catabolism regulator